MEEKVIVIGLGEIGSVVARGLLKLGYPVYPVTRSSNIDELAETIPAPRLVVVAVGENDLQDVLHALPNAWRRNVVLLQNELLPRDWENLIAQPTVISIWFEKKKGQDSKVILPSPVYGPQARLVHDALGTLGIPCRILRTPDELLYELVRKNVYILTINLAGLAVGGTVAQLWETHQQLARDVTKDVLKIQEKLTGTSLDLETYIKGMLEAFAGDPEHKCMGRTAPARLARALQQAQDYEIETPTLSDIRVTN